MGLGWLFLNFHEWYNYSTPLSFIHQVDLARTPGESEEAFWSSNQELPPVYHTRRRFYTIPLNAELQKRKLKLPIFMIFGLTRQGIEPWSTVSLADAFIYL